MYTCITCGESSATWEYHANHVCVPYEDKPITRKDFDQLMDLAKQLDQKLDRILDKDNPWSWNYRG